MRANEFVKKFGWDSAKKVLEVAPIRATSYRTSENNTIGLGGLFGRIDNEYGNIVLLSDLKRLVESWGLVESYGGLSHIGRLKNLINKTPKGATHACFQFNKFYRYDDFYGKWEEFWDAGSGLWVTVCGKHSGKVFSINKMKQAIKDVESCQ